MAPNKVTIDLEVTGEGKVIATLRGAGDEAERLGHRVNEVGKSGLGLREIFSGNLIANFFTAAASSAASFAAATVRAGDEAEKAQRFIFNSATSAKVALDSQIEAAERLRRELGLSRAEAQSGLAGATQLSSFVGRPQDSELFFKRLADLRAARGVSTDISELQRQLFTSDEGTDKLFGKNPGTIHAEYARALGTTAEKLSDAQKNQAIWNAVVTEGGKVTGAAASALTSQYGKVDLLANRWDDFTGKLGDFILENGLVNDSLRATIALLEGVTEAQGEFKLRGSEEARAAALNSAGASFETLVTDPLQKFFEVYLVGGMKLTGLAIKDLATLTPRSQSEAVATAQLLQERLKEIDEDRALNAGERQVEKNKAILDAEVRQGRWVNGRRLTDAELEQKRLDEQTAANAPALLRLERQSAYGDKFSDVLNVENLDERTAKLRELKAELSTIFDGAEVGKQTKKIDDALEKTRKEVEQTVATARDALRSFLNEAAAQADRDNPFTSLFVRARDEAEETRKKFLVFGEDFAVSMARVREEAVRTEIDTARLHSSLQSLKYEQEARRLERPLAGLTGPEERALATVSARIGGAMQGTAGAALAEALRAGRTGVGPAALAGRQFEELLRLEAGLGGLSGHAGDAARDAFDAQFKALYSGLDDRARAAALGQPSARERFSSAFARDALRAERDIRDAVEREQAGALIQQDARELLAAIQSSGLGDRQQVKEFLSVTGALSDRELVGDLRVARVNALRAGAGFEAQKEREGEERARRVDGVMQKLDRVLTERGLKLDGDAAKVQVEVVDRSDISRTSVLGGGW